GDGARVGRVRADPDGGRPTGVQRGLQRGAGGTNTAAPPPPDVSLRTPAATGVLADAAAPASLLVRPAAFPGRATASAMLQAAVSTAALAPGTTAASAPAFAPAAPDTTIGETVARSEDRR